MDASALIKVFHDEEGSDRIRAYVHDCTKARTFYTMPFRTTYLCFGETLGFFKNRMRRKEISREEYLQLSEEIMFSIASVFVIEEPPLNIIPELQNQVIKAIEKFGIDVSDAFQLVTVRWMYKNLKLAGGIRFILITADRDLAIAARSEGISAWNFLLEAAPEHLTTPASNQMEYESRGLEN